MIAKKGTEFEKKSMKQLKEVNNCMDDGTWLEQKAQGWRANN